VARIRTIKPEFWRHEDLSVLPESVHMLAAAILNYADDEGYFNANPTLIKADCFPLRELSVSIHEGLINLAEIHYLELGTDERGRRYGRVANFNEHQRVNRPTPSKFSGLQITWESSRKAHCELSEDSPQEGNREQGTGKGKEQGIKRADARSGNYPFSGEVVRLNGKHFSQWKLAFSNLDMLAELTARDAWLASDRATDSDRKNWFISTSKYLANRNSEAMQTKQAPPPPMVDAFGIRLVEVK